MTASVATIHAARASIRSRRAHFDTWRHALSGRATVSASLDLLDQRVAARA